MMLSIKQLLSQLIQYPSITPNDHGCQTFLIEQLETLGFHCQRFDNPPVANFYASLGNKQPLLLFAGHTDVVPAGNLAQWSHPPFSLHEANGFYYGRGVADMKGSLAAMMIALSKLVNCADKWHGSIGCLITSGEEGNHYQQGTPFVMEQLLKQGIKPDYCIVGEPSSTQHVGDVIKIGRRGSLNARVSLQGIQGHVAYPHLADNPIHRLAPALNELIATAWDEGNAHFPPTSLQITHLEAGGEANNIIPGEITLQFNIRYSSEQTEEQLKQRINACFKHHGLTPSIDWTLSGEPFLTAEGRLLDSAIRVITEQCSKAPELSTSGGTSDGRFIAPYGIDVIELGPVNQSIHQVNECVAVDDLDRLAELYYSIALDMLGV